CLPGCLCPVSWLPLRPLPRGVRRLCPTAWRPSPPLPTLPRGYTRNLPTWRLPATTCVRRANLTRWGDGTGADLGGVRIPRYGVTAGVDRGRPRGTTSGAPPARNARRGAVATAGRSTARRGDGGRLGGHQPLRCGCGRPPVDQEAST